jgi:hypothetical protein
VVSSLRKLSKLSASPMRPPAAVEAALVVAAISMAIPSWLLLTP